MAEVYGDPLVLFLMISILLIGVALGAVLFGSRSNGVRKEELDKVRSEEREKFKAQKEAFTNEIGQSLQEMRSGMIMTIEAYRKSLQTLEARLDLPAEERRLLEHSLGDRSARSDSETSKQSPEAKSNSVSRKKITQSDEATRTGVRAEPAPTGTTRSDARTKAA